MTSARKLLTAVARRSRTVASAARGSSSSAPGRRMAARLAAAGLSTGLVAAAGCGAPAAHSPQQAPAKFLAGYARPDGRVVRLDQGGDTVSEGQAYGMLIAESTGNSAAAARIWTWTRDHLQLGDGLFAWHANAAGRVIGQQPASDADLLIAWALLRYHGPQAASWHRAGRRVAAAIIAHEVTSGPGGVPVLAAGPWATGKPASLDPSYWSLTAFQQLARLTGDQIWQRMAAGAVSLTRELTRDGKALPPDWAELTAAGALRPEPAPDGSQPQTQYGPDAQRTVVWFAASCDPQARTLAARWWPLLRSGDHGQALALTPSGSVLNAAPQPLALVASAAAAKAAGDGSAEQKLLQRAKAGQQAHPTYYGGAWSVLGPVLLGGSTLATC
ncbi:MAG TPA: glycosyl hydrolase family 8 [Streptosporangiaceae bacterium]